MRNHSLMSLFLSIACILSLFCMPTTHAKAAGFDPYFLDTPPNLEFDPNSLDITGNPLGAGIKALQLGWIYNLDPDSVKRLARTYITCSNPGTPSLYGLTVGLMYCIKLHISDATHIFNAGISNPNNRNFPATNVPINFFVKLYQSCCFLLAISLFGLRLMAMQSESVKKDVFNFLIKFAVAFFLITQSAKLFDIFSGAVGEGIGWLSSLTGMLGDDPKSCFSLVYTKLALVDVASKIPPNDPNFNYGEYEPWHKIDCLFVRIFGAGPPSAGTINFLGFTVDIPINVGQANLVYGSIVPLVGLLMFTSTLGLSAGLLGLGALIMFIKVIMKAMFLVLSAYLTMALFALLTPFMAPLIVFESHRNDAYPMRIFKRWMGLLMGAFIQPIVIVAYLGFAAVLLNTFIQGDISEDPAIRSIFANCNKDATADGICSMNQLAPPFPNWTTTVGGTTIPNVGFLGTYDYMSEINPILAHTKILGDPQTQSSDCSFVDRKLTYIQSINNDLLNQIDNKAASVTITGPSRLKIPITKTTKLALTFTCLLFIGFILLQLMNTIPQLATSLSKSSVIKLWEGASGPLVDAAEAALSGAKKAASGAGKYGSSTDKPGMKAARGAAEGISNFLTGKRS